MNEHVKGPSRQACFQLVTVTQVLAFCATAIGLAGALGYGLRLPPLYAWLWAWMPGQQLIVGMAPNTAIAVALLGTAIICNSMILKMIVKRWP